MCTVLREPTCNHAACNPPSFQMCEVLSMLKTPIEFLSSCGLESTLLPPSQKFALVMTATSRYCIKMMSPGCLRPGSHFVCSFPPPSCKSSFFKHWTKHLASKISFMHAAKLGVLKALKLSQASVQQRYPPSSSSSSSSLPRHHASLSVLECAYV